MIFHPVSQLWAGEFEVWETFLNGHFHLFESYGDYALLGIGIVSNTVQSLVSLRSLSSDVRMW